MLIIIALYYSFDLFLYFLSCLKSEHLKNIIIVLIINNHNKIIKINTTFIIRIATKTKYVIYKYINKLSEKFNIKLFIYQIRSLRKFMNYF